jgi:hypothetical protein
VLQRAAGIPGLYHAFILTTQRYGDLSTDETRYYRAGPGVDDKIQANYGRYKPGTPDWEPTHDRYLTLWRNGSCAPYDKSFEWTAFRTNASHIPYANTSTNSNAFAYTALLKAGIEITYDDIRYLYPDGGALIGWGIVLEFDPKYPEDPI